MFEINGKPFKPLLAATTDLLSINFPAGVTPKLDGIRCVIIDGTPRSRTLKQIQNKRICKTLNGIPHVLDGEILAAGGNFQSTTTAVMASDSELPWEYHVFDVIIPGKPDATYTERISYLRDLFDTEEFPPEVKLLEPTYVYDLDHLQELVQIHLQEGYEGTCVRNPRGHYKYGRSTMREGILLKLKQFVDGEATIIGFEEQLENRNAPVTNALGHTERSTHKENKVSTGLLGAFIVEDLVTGLQFKVGTGLTRTQRREFWENQDAYLGKLVKYKSMEFGVKEKPRHPVFLGFRDPSDM